ncbi:C6 zinc finger domain-containing protein [Pyrenochaeta sp. MPI-SDFR-AT-0127]|nr:C6 zinc finger domain-containing protein [Pyrenochaeta sp. MPI-SDFR-AT-0127]
MGYFADVCTRSDNLRPACSSCQQIGTPCEYIKQDASTFDAASLRILDRLSVIENLVRGLHPSQSLNFSSPSASSSSQRQPVFILPSEIAGIPGSERVTFALNLDASFRAATDKILQWPVFEKPLSPLQRLRFVDFHGSEAHTYLDDLLTQSDISTLRPSLDSSRDPSISINISTERSDIEQLVDQFFTRVNIKNPILSRQVASQYCQQYYEHGPLFNLETCLVLLMCSLGAVSMEFDPFDEGQSPGNSPYSSSRVANLRLGSCYFVAAEKRLGSAISNINTLAIQCLCLAGIYHMYLIRPMHALRMFHAAGSSLQILASTGADSHQGKSQIYSSLFWTCYKSEREILAEIPICAPALREPGTTDSYPPPPQATSTVPCEWASYEEDSWYFFLSEIALRRITDHVAEVVSNHIDANIRSYNSRSIEELIPIVAEFERQAETFRENLPPAIQFPDVPEIASTEWKQYSRGRYYRVLELMHRPFLFTAIHEPGCSTVVQALAEKALVNALRYLQHSLVSHRHHGTWLQLRNELKEASLLLAASKSTGLKMPHGWEAGVAKSLATFDYWLWEFPSCRTYANVILALTDSPLTSTDGEMPTSFT